MMGAGCGDVDQLMGQGVGVWIRSWGRVLGCGLDPGGQV